MLTPNVHAKSLGVVGPVYEVKEESVLVTIQNRLKAMESTGELERRMEEARQRSIRSVEQPAPLGVPASDKAMVSYYDPTIQVSEDILGHDGKIVVKKGTIVNPLDQVSLNSHLLFFDGASQDQLKYVLKRVREDTRIKPIMTGGKPLELMREWKQRLYYDQGGTLVSKLGIKHVPAIVTQEGKRLRIDIIPEAEYQEKAQ